MVIVGDSVGNVGSQSQNFGFNLATLEWCSLGLIPHTSVSPPNKP